MSATFSFSAMADLLTIITHIAMVRNATTERPIATTTVEVPSGRCARNSLTGKIITDLLRDYDQNLLPSATGANVSIELHVQEISSLSELTSDFELDIMYSEIWHDERLQFNNLNMSICAKNLTLKAEFRQKIWTPDTCIINSKSSFIHRSPSENTFVMLYDDGKVWANYRMKVKAPCKLDLSMFPFDTQQCFLMFESYSFNAEEVLLTWHDHPMTFMGEINLPDFGLVGVKSEKSRLTYPNGIWERVTATFVFKRRFGFYLFQAYFPTSLTVLSSWVGFLLDTRSVSARITLGVSSLLALTFQFGTVLRHLPRVSYIKCLDVWMITCVIFIFLTLVQLAFVCQLSRRERERQVGTQVITQWLHSIRKKRAEAAQSASPQNGMVGGGESSEGKHYSSKWKAFLERASAEGAAEGGMSGGPPTRDILTETDSLLPSNRRKRPSPTLNSCLNALAQAISLIADLKITSVNVDRASMVLFPLVFGVFNAVYWTYYLVQINVAASAKDIKTPVYVGGE